MTVTPNDEVDVEDLIVGHFEGTLSQEQEKQFAAALNTSAESRQLFLSHMRLEGRLHSLGRDGFLSEPNSDAVVTLDWRQPQLTEVSTRVRGTRQRLHLFAASSFAVFTMMLILLAGIMWPSSVSASSVLQKAQKAAAELIDRTYHVTISGPNKRSQTRELTINVRGGGRFVIQPADGSYAMGSDGTDFWVTPENGPVLVTSDIRSITPELRKRIPVWRLVGLAASPDEPLLLGISDLLSLIERRYDVKLVESDTVKEHHMRATANSSRPNYPEVIDLWSDVESGVVLRAKSRLPNGRERRFELIESAKLSAQWYHYAEHAPGRMVERIHAAD